MLLYVGIIIFRLVDDSSENLVLRIYEIVIFNTEIKG